MKVRAQVSMVFHLDKCIGCHTCSVACKNQWTDRKGLEYAWWNNVETKPGIGYPKDWENQARWRADSAPVPPRRSQWRRRSGQPNVPPGVPGCDYSGIVPSRGLAPAFQRRVQHRAPLRAAFGWFQSCAGSPTSLKATWLCGKKHRRGKTLGSHLGDRPAATQPAGRVPAP